MCLAACRQGSARRKGQGGEGPARVEEGEDRASLVAPWVEEGGRAVPLAARALLPPTIKKIVFLVFYVFLWFFGVFTEHNFCSRRPFFTVFRCLYIYF